LEGLVGRPLHSSIIFNYSNVTALAEHIAGGAQVEARADESEPDGMEQAFAGVSDAEAERLLMQELATLEGSEIG
jgi:hypothetical protein